MDPTYGRENPQGFSLIEMMVVLVIFALTLTVAVPAYRDYVIRAESAKAIADIGLISIAVRKFRNNNGDNPPPNLAAIDRALDDPWGNPYVYLDLAGTNPGDSRKNKNLNPINTDYDLYSMGPDGDSKLPLTVPVSHDDIVRANNGAFIGIARDY